ncbi:MAG: hypothetical protein R3C99_03895 [Pirellulaceae bacterium]
MRPIDVNHSGWDCTLEPAAEGGGIAVGDEAAARDASRSAAAGDILRDQHGSFHSIEEFTRVARDLANR